MLPDTVYCVPLVKPVIPANVFPLGVIVTTTSLGAYLSNVAVVGVIVAGLISGPDVGSLPNTSVPFLYAVIDSHSAYEPAALYE